MFLNETYSRFVKGEHLSDTFAIQSDIAIVSLSLSLSEYK
jgi:hypothetical protein